MRNKGRSWEVHGSASLSNDFGGSAAVPAATAEPMWLCRGLI